MTNHGCVERPRLDTSTAARNQRMHSSPPVYSYCCTPEQTIIITECARDAEEGGLHSTSAAAVSTESRNRS